MRHPLKHILLTTGLALATSAYAAGNFTVFNGSWAVTSELNGQPGRGMSIDVQDGILAMPVYNYNAQGEPTFHLTSGPIVDNRFQGVLSQYRGGRSFGGPHRDGVLTGSAGTVEVRFIDANNGTVQFPGESPLPITRYQFDGMHKPWLSLPGTDQWWAVAQLGGDLRPVNLWWMQFRTSLEPGGGVVTKIKSVTTQGLSFASDTTCTSASDSDAIVCKLPLANSGETVTMRMRPTLDSLSGTFVNDQIPSTVHTLVGGRIYTQTSNGITLDTPLISTDLGGIQRVVPETGTWLVSSEANGQAGRGMAIDVQNDTLVLQVYNYDASGAPTFHLATGPYVNGQTTARLKHYKGGRYFGGDARIGAEAGDAGEVTLSFTSPTEGLIRFPGEIAVPIHRFEFGTHAEVVLGRLLGQWAFLDVPERKFSRARLTTLTNGVVEGDGLQCTREITPQGNLRCVEVFRITGRPDVYLRDFRFRMNFAGRAMGVSMVIDAQGRVTNESRPLVMLRTADANGVLAGNGSMATPSDSATSRQTIAYTATDENRVERASSAIVHLPAAAERRPVVLMGPGWDGGASLAPVESPQAAQLARAGYVAVDLGLNSTGSPWDSDLPYNAQAALTKLCADFAQRVNCDAIIWSGVSYSGTQSLTVTNYLRSKNHKVLGFVSQDAGYTLYWGVPNHANLLDYSVAMIENLGDSEFPVDLCKDGNCGARERATWHRNNGVHTDKILSWCPAGGDHGTRNNVPGGAQGWDNWVLSAVKTMLHTHRGVPTFAGYTPGPVAVSNACVAP